MSTSLYPSKFARTTQWPCGRVLIRLVNRVEVSKRLSLRNQERNFACIYIVIKVAVTTILVLFQKLARKAVLLVYK